MKYQCPDGHIFVIPGRIIAANAPEKALNFEEMHNVVTITYETACCPICKDTKFSEYVEPQPEITSVKSVDLAQVDDFLKQGYTVRELYAKTATLVKLEAKQ